MTFVYSLLHLMYVYYFLISTNENIECIVGSTTLKTYKSTLHHEVVDYECELRVDEFNILSNLQLYRW